MRNRFDIRFSVASAPQDSGQVREIGDRVHVRRALLAAECAVEIRADAAVPRVAGELADVVDVIDDGLERHAGRAPAWTCPRTQPGTSIQASNAAPMTAPRAISSRI